MEFVEYQTPSAWKSKDFDDSSWIDILSNAQREELLMLAKSLPDNEDEWLNISKDDLALNFLKPLFIQTNKELDMGSGWDFFGNKSWIDYDSITDIQKNNRNYLQMIMNQNGFKSYSKEWWHFTLINEPYPDTYFDF